jgi:predicted RNase H-like HicB family nuclease
VRYTVLIDGKPGAYGVVFPDLPGCCAMATTVDEALAHAGDALRDWIELTEEYGERVPPPRSRDTLRRDPEVVEALAEGSAFAVVSVRR